MRIHGGWTLAVLMGAIAALGGHPAGAAIDGTALLRQVDRRLNPPSYDAYKRLINVEPNGRTREYLLYQVAEGREKVAALFLSPASDKGRSTRQHVDVRAERGQTDSDHQPAVGDRRCVQ